jgi:hypothetical protein
MGTLIVTVATSRPSIPRTSLRETPPRKKSPSFPMMAPLPRARVPPRIKKTVRTIEKGNNKGTVLFKWHPEDKQSPTLASMRNQYSINLRTSANVAADKAKHEERQYGFYHSLSFIHHHSFSPSHLINHPTSLPLSQGEETRRAKRNQGGGRTQRKNADAM